MLQLPLMQVHVVPPAGIVPTVQVAPELELEVDDELLDVVPLDELLEVTPPEELLDVMPLDEAPTTPLVDELPDGEPLVERRDNDRCLRSNINHVAKRKLMMSPSRTMYSLPSRRTSP